MGRLIIPANAQLSEKEQVCVYVSTETKRILGFGHESMPVPFAAGYERKVLTSAIVIEKWAEKYRQQEALDREQEDCKISMREAPARRAIRQALLDRRSRVDGPNRAYIDANIRLMDQREARAQQRQVKSYLLSEKYEAGVLSEDIALEHPAFKE